MHLKGLRARPCGAVAGFELPGRTFGGKRRPSERLAGARRPMGGFGDLGGRAGHQGLAAGAVRSRTGWSACSVSGNAVRCGKTMTHAMPGWCSKKLRRAPSSAPEVVEAVECTATIKTFQ